LAKKAKSSPGPSTGSSQNVSDVEIAVFGSRAHLEKQALATVILFTAHYPQSFGFLLSFHLVFCSFLSCFIAEEMV
jgi:hypothetical protein